MIKYVIMFFVLFSTSATASNWVVVQGTQSDKAPQHNIWGFFQLRGSHYFGEVVEKNGVNQTPFNLVTPKLEDQSLIQLARMRMGARGKLDSDNTINYFLLGEFGDNGFTNPAGEAFENYLSDASLTFRYWPVAIRIGRFKYPANEEGSMARFASPFIVFSRASDHLMLERFIAATTNVTKDTAIAKPSQGVGAFRDTGIELFEELFIDANQRLTWVYILGAGVGTQTITLPIDNTTHYFYLSHEVLFNHKRAYKRESLKSFMWAQYGKRLLANQHYDRVRYGLGVTYHKSGLRIDSEILAGQGMIFSGVKDVDKSAGVEAWYFQMRPSLDNGAWGYYLSSQYSLNRDVEIIGRLDGYHRYSADAVDQRDFYTLTTGVSYRFLRASHLDINYEINRHKAPFNAAADTILSNAGDIFRIQLTWVLP